MSPEVRCRIFCCHVGTSESFGKKKKEKKSFGFWNSTDFGFLG
jgi:hypothetical protein